MPLLHRGAGLSVQMTYKLGSCVGTEILRISSVRTVFRSSGIYPKQCIKVQSDSLSLKLGEKQSQVKCPLVVRGNCHEA